MEFRHSIPLTEVDVAGTRRKLYETGKEIEALRLGWRRSPIGEICRSQVKANFVLTTCDIATDDRRRIALVDRQEAAKSSYSSDASNRCCCKPVLRAASAPPTKWIKT